MITKIAKVVKKYRTDARVYPLNPTEVYPLDTVSWTPELLKFAEISFIFRKIKEELSLDCEYWGDDTESFEDEEYHEYYERSWKIHNSAGNMEFLRIIYTSVGKDKYMDLRIDSDVPY